MATTTPFRRPTPRRARAARRRVCGVPGGPGRRRRILRELRPRPAARTGPHGTGMRPRRRGQRPRPAAPPQRGRLRRRHDHAARRRPRVRGGRLRRRLLGHPPRRGVTRRLARGERVPARRPAARHAPAAGDARGDPRRLRGGQRAGGRTAHGGTRARPAAERARVHDRRRGGDRGSAGRGLGRRQPGVLDPGGPFRTSGAADRGRLVGRADGRRRADGRGRGVRRPPRARDHGLAGRGRVRTGAAHRGVQAGPPGVVVVCTDGLWNYAESADDMAEAVPADAAARPCTPPACWSVTPSTAAATTT